MRPAAPPTPCSSPPCTRLLTSGPPRIINHSAASFSTRRCAPVAAGAGCQLALARAAARPVRRMSPTPRQQPPEQLSLAPSSSQAAQQPRSLAPCKRALSKSLRTVEAAAPIPSDVRDHPVRQVLQRGVEVQRGRHLAHHRQDAVGAREGGRGGDGGKRAAGSELVGSKVRLLDAPAVNTNPG